MEKKTSLYNTELHLGWRGHPCSVKLFYFSQPVTCKKFDYFKAESKMQRSIRRTKST